MSRKTKPSAQEIANIAGVSLTSVHRKLSQGKTPRQIIAEAEEAQQVALRGLPTTPVSTGLNGHAADGALTLQRRARVKRNKEIWLARLRELDYQERAREVCAHGGGGV